MGEARAPVVFATSSVRSSPTWAGSKIAPKSALLRRLAAASFLAEAIEAQALNGSEINLAEYCNLASTTVRISSRVGLTRQTRNVTPTLAEYIEAVVDETECDEGDER
jgi:hypothetical protein